MLIFQKYLSRWFYFAEVIRDGSGKIIPLVME
jgi:hypothetical protein